MGKRDSVVDHEQVAVSLKIVHVNAVHARAAGMRRKNTRHGVEAEKRTKPDAKIFWHARARTLPASSGLGTS
jgi:hypothetical protein